MPVPAERTINLLKEYTDKLRAFRAEAWNAFQHCFAEKGPGKAREIWEEDLADRDAQWHSMRESHLDLARAASQELEYGQLSGLDKVELKLRLSEFEQKVADLDHLFQRAKTHTRR